MKTSQLVIHHDTQKRTYTHQTEHIAEKTTLSVTVFAFGELPHSPVWHTVMFMQNIELLICESFTLLKKPEGWLTELGVRVLSPQRRQNTDCCPHW